MQHTKTKVILCDTLDLHLKKPLSDLLKTSPFSLLCDKSISEVILNVLTKMVRSFDPRSCCYPAPDTIGITNLTARNCMKVQLAVYQPA